MAAVPTLATAQAFLLWGEPADEREVRNKLHLELCGEEPCFARLTHRNGYVVGSSPPRDYRFEVDGFSVVVRIETRPFEEGDLILISPPPGYVAQPRELRVEEGETVEIEIYPLPMS